MIGPSASGRPHPTPGADQPARSLDPEEGKSILRALFDHYVEHPPPGVEGATVPERVTDRIAGMTDRFSIREFEALAVPRSFA